MDMAQTMDDRISIRVSRTTKKLLKEKALRDGRTLSNWAARILLTHEQPSGEIPVHGKKTVNG